MNAGDQPPHRVTAVLWADLEGVGDSSSRAVELTRASLTRQQFASCRCVEVTGGEALDWRLPQGESDLVLFVEPGTLVFDYAVSELADLLRGRPEVAMVSAAGLQGRPDSIARIRTLGRRLAKMKSTSGQLETDQIWMVRREWLAARLTRSLATPREAMAALTATAARERVYLRLPWVLAVNGMTQPGGRPVAAPRLAQPPGRYGHAAWRVCQTWLRKQPDPWELLGRALQPVGFRGLRRASPARAAVKIGFVVWRYPMLSETFIQGEVSALRDSGVEVEVVAEGRDEPPMPDEPIPAKGGVTYLGSLDKQRGRAMVMRMLWVRPWTVWRLWLLLIRHQHPLGTWWSVRNDLYAAGQLAAALRQCGVNHVHAGWADAFAMHAFVASRLLGLPFSVQARASEVHRVVHRAALLDRIRFARFIVTNTRYNERHLRARLRTEPHPPPVHVIYNGVDLARFDPALRTRKRDGVLRLLSVGRMVEPKGFRSLLEAVALLRDRGVDVRCDLIGTAEETATWVEIRMCWSEWNLQSRVRFLGARPSADVIAALAGADIFVLPCIRGRDGSHDITPNVLLEAMAMQLPVVSTTSGAVPELVTHGVDGWLVPPGDAPSLADAIERLFRDQALADQLGRAARGTVEQRFDLRRNVAHRVALFSTATA